MPLPLSSTEHTRRNNTRSSISDTFSNNNGKSDAQNNSTVSIDNNKDNGNFAIDSEHIMNYKSSFNNHSSIGTIIVSSQKEQNLKSDIISIRYFDKTIHINNRNKKERFVINLSGHVFTEHNKCFLAFVDHHIK